MSTRTSHDEIVLQAVQVFFTTGPEDDKVIGTVCPYLYVPHPKLQAYLLKLENFTNGGLTLTAIDAGNLLEQVTVLLFAGLQGAEEPLSVRTADAQLDVLQLGGTDVRWLALNWILGFRAGQTSFLVECKCYQPDTKGVIAKVPQREYARIAGLMQTSLMESVGMGVMVSIEGGSDGEYRRAVGESRLFRIKHHARFRVPIIDITLSDIRKYGLLKGGLPRLLLSKLQELTQLAGLELLTGDSPQHDSLPPHIQEVLAP